MSKCCCNNDSKYFKTPNAGVCDICKPNCEASEVERIAICPPVGEPKLLTLMAPVVFDECGLNLCRVFSVDQLVDVCEGPTPRTTDILFDGITSRDLKNATNVQLQVVDVDFNFVCPTGCRYSEMRPAKNTPNMTRVTLRDLDVTFAVKLLDCSCRVFKEGMMTLRYLPCEECPGYDEDTNPSSVTFDLYTPYGISYAPENPAGCNKLVPTINYVGFVENQHCQGCDCEGTVYKTFEANNSLRQGISAQALATVIGSDDECFAVGVTLYIKAVYFVQYKFCHEGLCVPPKFTAADRNQTSSCVEFCKGNLLEQSITPLSVCTEPKTTKGACCAPCGPCVDPCNPCGTDHSCGHGTACSKGYL
ncbi:MAG: hypothetical protein ACRCW2_03120 [Cellulosilyticaceae bacterium]